MCGLAVYSVREGPIRSSGDLDIKEGDGVVFFLLHGEFDEWMLRVEMLQELVKLKKEIFTHGCTRKFTIHLYL